MNQKKYSYKKVDLDEEESSESYVFNIECLNDDTCTKITSGIICSKQELENLDNFVEKLLKTKVLQ